MKKRTSVPGNVTPAARVEGGKNERDLIARSAPWKWGERIVEECTAVTGEREREGKDDIIPLSQFAKQIYAWDGPGAGIYDNV